MEMSNANSKFGVVDQGYADEGEGEDNEKKTWAWLADDSVDVPQKPEIKVETKKEDA